MKRILLSFGLLLMCSALWSQKTITPDVLTVVYATSDDGFLNVRSKPSMKGKVLTKLYGVFHGLGNGVLRDKGDSWSKVAVYGVTGWVYTKYLGYQTWYTGKGKRKLVANIDDMPIYGENYADLSGIECVTNLVDDEEELKKLFKSYAESWSTLAVDSDAISTLKLDSHSPAKVRVNAVLASNKKFNEVYDLKEGDGMYIAPEERVSRW